VVHSDRGNEVGNGFRVAHRISIAALFWENLQGEFMRVPVQRLFFFIWSFYLGKLNFVAIGQLLRI
jgi:hypothetical protein